MKPILLALALLSPVFLPVSQVRVTLIVHHIQSQEGVIGIGVYDKAETFNEETVASFQFPKQNMQNGELECTFTLPEGTYAFSLLDDLNEDEKMNFNLIGVPTEGFGFSRDAKIQFLTAPDFEDCAVQVNEQNQRFRIKMRYF